MQKNFRAGKITTIAILTAVSVILRLLGFPQNGTFRIELGFIPIAISGAIFGPLSAGTAYVIADILGTLCTGFAPAPTITLCKFLIGILFGLFFHKGNRRLFRIVIAVTVITIFIDLLAMPFALVPIMGGKSFFVILSDRLLAALFNYPLKILSLWLTFKYLNPVIEKEVSKYGHN